MPSIVRVMARSASVLAGCGEFVAITPFQRAPPEIFGFGVVTWIQSL